MNQTVRRWHWGEDSALLRSVMDRGGMLAIPTESSYGLGVDPRSRDGVATLYRFKGRPRAKALPVVLGDLDQLTLLGGDPGREDLQELAALWPAPLTVVVPLRSPLPASSGALTLAVRIPEHQRLRSLLLDLGTPLTATSANPSGGRPVSDPSMLTSMLSGWLSVIVDGGVLAGGAASTIVQIGREGYRVLRVGALTPGWLSERLSRPVFSATAAEIPADDSQQGP